MTSTLHKSSEAVEAARERGVHVAIILDGSGRWAEMRGRSRSAGHRAGVENVRRVVEAASGFGITTLTLYAFSVHNWQRPEPEVTELLGVLRDFLLEQVAEAPARDVRVRVIGRRDRVPATLRASIVAAEAATAHARGLELRLAIDYSARESILRAAQRLAGVRGVTAETFAHGLDGERDAASDVDFLIRTGGERRLSDFLLWEIAHAELWFTPTLWPEFRVADLGAAMAEFRTRERSFGGLRRAV
jgi:undecaprenyl diphosphate synthase